MYQSRSLIDATEKPLRCPPNGIGGESWRPISPQKPNLTIQLRRKISQKGSANLELHSSIGEASSSRANESTNLILGYQESGTASKESETLLDKEKTQHETLNSATTHLAVGEVTRRLNNNAQAFNAEVTKICSYDSRHIHVPQMNKNMDTQSSNISSSASSPASSKSHHTPFKTRNETIYRGLESNSSSPLEEYSFKPQEQCQDYKSGKSITLDIKYAIPVTIIHSLYV